MNFETSNEQVAWNLSSILIEQIGLLLKKAITENINGKIGNAFRVMQNIRLLIHHDLSPDEVKDLIDIEKKASAIINNGDLYKGFKADEDKKAKYFIGLELYIKYHNKIMNALKKHGYSIPGKLDSTRIN